MNNDFYVKRSKKFLNHKAPHQKPPRVRNNKRVRNNQKHELDVNSEYLKSTYCFIQLFIKLLIEDCINIAKFWLILYVLSLICKYFL